MRTTHAHRLLAVYGIALFSSVLYGQELTKVCPLAPTEQQAKTLTDYVRKEYRLPDTINLALRKVVNVRDTCYREITFQGKSALRTWDLTLYASPDLRFLSSELFDTTIDPIQEQRAKDETLMKGLVQGPGATLGPRDAKVTIVEFADFECPYCRTFAAVLKEALSTGGEDDVRVVFHHLPLSMHPWAREAAEVAECAQLQSNAAFWSLHDQIFQNQSLITADNANDRLIELAKESKGVDTTALHKCIDSRLSVGLVLQDISLAEAYQIRATPAVFINGHSVHGVDSAAKLRDLIAQAREDAAPPSIGSSTLRSAR